MKNIIVGTAGHIDHGKTTLIKALTGKNTDRLKEEQKRGISIDLGFTFFDLPSGLRAGIIDVPGHEKFIKNMLAGVIGMDVVILVVAADEGMMPQSIEHLEIMNLLGLKEGFIVLTKCDSQDEDWLDLVEEETKEVVKGTFLEGKKVIRIDSVSGRGIDAVKEEIDRVVSNINYDDKLGDLPRLPIDRSFTISGFGTVVTGTLLSGELKLGEEVQIFPKDLQSRIRSLQVHDTDVEIAYKGQRVAVNLANVKKEEVERGDMLAPVGSMIPTKLLDVKIKTINLPYTLSNRTRIRLYLATSEVFARIIILDSEELEENQEAICQLALEETVVARKGDRFIIRLFSPMITVGGGEVIDANPKRKKRFNEDDIKQVELMESNDSIDVTEAVIKEHSREFLGIKDLAKLRAFSLQDAENDIEKLEEDNRIVVVKLTKDSFVVHRDYFNNLKKDIVRDIGKYHEKYPLRPGMSKEELRSKYFNKANKKVGELFLDIVQDEEKIEANNEFIRKEGFKISFNEKDEKVKEQIIKAFEKEFLISPKLEEIFKGEKLQKQEISEVYQALIASGQLYRLNTDTVLLKKNFEESVARLTSYLKEKGSITLAEARDEIATNRKIALAILEYMDDNNITKRDGEVRVIV